ncbi:MAG TPA: anthranilate synthase component I family protein [Candidatus Polarisedimenticolaceae bacterium]|nr:anthranilate synthase component I family protein [Candidatus Polarisedimenticolaceae bacterium]
MPRLAAAVAPEHAVPALRRPGEPAIFFDGRGGHDGSWPCRLLLQPRLSTVQGLDALSVLIQGRRERGGPGGTGVAAAFRYEGGFTAWESDASLTFESGGTTGAGDRALLDDAERRLDREPPGLTAPHASGAPDTSLPRERYLAAVRRIQDHIRRGDIYQANLTQTLSRSIEGDPWPLYETLASQWPAPRSAFVEARNGALLSISPEVFVDVTSGGLAETRPIKGTRRRHEAPDLDRRAAEDLLASAKDRAELVMIVDLERNDLGRLARTGTVRVPELLALKSYPTVHHLVARVTAELEDRTAAALIRAVFPGGSIVGAPKERAREILRSLEPVPRGLYTGSLFWFDDDGSTLSSILIRSIVVSRGLASVGAGGGILADSDPEAEWAEANDKARALTGALGFMPEEAS